MSKAIQTIMAVIKDSEDAGSIDPPIFGNLN